MGSALGLLSLRTVVGLVFVVHGTHKLFGFGLAGTAGFLGGLGIPLPTVAAAGVIAVELLGGLALLPGAGTRIAATLLAVDMLVAMLTVHPRGGFFVPDGVEFVLTPLRRLPGAGRAGRRPVVRRRRAERLPGQDLGRVRPKRFVDLVEVLASVDGPPPVEHGAGPSVGLDDRVAHTGDSPIDRLGDRHRELGRDAGREGQAKRLRRVVDPVDVALVLVGRCPRWASPHPLVEQHDDALVPEGDVREDARHGPAACHRSGEILVAEAPDEGAKPLPLGIVLGHVRAIHWHWPTSVSTGSHPQGIPGRQSVPHAGCSSGEPRLGAGDSCWRA
jgi:putative oxidoreductase